MSRGVWVKGTKTHEAARPNPENRKIASRPTGPDNAQIIGANLAEMAGFGCAKGVEMV